MPKKGKGKKKGEGKKKGGPALAPPPAVVVDDELDMQAKQFYTVQIEDLEMRLRRYQEKSDRLQVKNEELEKESKQKLEDQEETIMSLKRLRFEDKEALTAVENKLVAVQQAKNTEKDRFELQISRLKEVSQRAQEKTRAENKDFRKQLEHLHDFEMGKVKFEKLMKTREEQIEQMSKEHEEALYKLEKKVILDKDRMKKDMVNKVNSVASEFRKVSDLQMAETTKRTIRENVAINSQLLQMSAKTTELIKQNDQLRASKKDLMLNTEILEFNEKELTRKNISLQKVIRMINDKVGKQSTQVSMLEDKVTQGVLMEAHVSQAQEAEMAYQRESEFYKSKLFHVEEDLKETRRRLADMTSEHAKLSDILRKASTTIQASLLPVSDSEYTTQRENLLSILLQLLNVHTSHQKTQSPLSSDHSKMPCYQPGDLGIVPVPKSKGHKAVSSSHFEGPANPQLPLINSKTALTGFQLAEQVQ